MKSEFVLNNEEKERRYNKINKVHKNAFNQNQTIPRPSIMQFSISLFEKKIHDDIYSKLQLPFLQNFVMFDRSAALNVIKYVYGIAGLEIGSWRAFKNSESFHFRKYILPSFPELAELSAHDVGQITNSSASGIAMFFRCCQVFCMESDVKGKLKNNPESYFVSDRVQCISGNPDIVSALDLSDILSRLDLSKDVTDTRMPTYEELYPANWAGDRAKEEMHKKVVLNILSWPRGENNLVSLYKTLN